jgi:hypothetical protein
MTQQKAVARANRAAICGSSIQSVTPLDYRNPNQLPDGGVLVVGASATGVQLADERDVDAVAVSVWARALAVVVRELVCSFEPEGLADAGQGQIDGSDESVRAALVAGCRASPDVIRCPRTGTAWL